jgi:hypothetical protein
MMVTNLPIDISASATPTVMQMPPEEYCDSCICSVGTIYVPVSLATCLASFGRGMVLCVNSESAACVLKSHPRFDQLIEGDKENS